LGHRIHQSYDPRQTAVVGAGNLTPQVLQGGSQAFAIQS
jgi:hypothetical protein